MKPFTKKLAAYGADVSTALERFLDDEDLLENCFMLMLEDENFLLLKEQIGNEDYDAAFNSAHALKGVLSNLELTPLLMEVNTLLESLRAKDYSQIMEQQQKIEEELERLEMYDLK